MIFTVVWKPSAEHSLAEMWLEHKAGRSALSDAANQIDFLLRQNPQEQGKPYIGQARTLLVLPLGVLFRVFESDRLVRILAAWYIPSYTTNGVA